jgi:hypothetical protein
MNCDIASSLVSGYQHSKDTRCVYLEDGGSKFLRNANVHLQNYRV